MAVSITQLGLNCHECDEQLKKERGCTEKGITPTYLGNEIYWRCPLTIVPRYTWRYMTAYKLYTSGFLPNGSGWINESQKFLDAMTIIDNEFSAIEQSNLKKIKDKHGRAKG